MSIKYSGTIDYLLIDNQDFEFTLSLTRSLIGIMVVWSVQFEFNGKSLHTKNNSEQSDIHIILVFKYYYLQSKFYYIFILLLSKKWHLLYY